MEHRVVPGVAFRHAALPVGTLGVDLLELGIDPFRAPTEPERDVDHMHPEVAHHADLAAGPHLAFPVHRFRGVEVARMPEAGADLEQLAQFAGPRRLHDALCAGQERELAAAPDETARGRGGVADPASIREVDAERLLGQQVFAGREHVEVDRGMEVVGHGHIHHVDLRRTEQLFVVLREQLHGRDLPEPVEQLVLEVADRDELGLHREILQHEPPPECARGFAPHQPAPDDPDPHHVAHMDADSISSHPGPAQAGSSGNRAAGRPSYPGQ